MEEIFALAIIMLWSFALSVIFSWFIVKFIIGDKIKWGAYFKSFGIAMLLVIASSIASLVFLFILGDI